MKQKTYLDKLMENKEFKEKIDKEYKLIKELEEDHQKAIDIIKKAIENADQPQQRR